MGATVQLVTDGGASRAFARLAMSKRAEHLGAYEEDRHVYSG